MYYFVVNPNARSGKGKSIWQKVCRVMNDKGLVYEALFTEKKGQAAKLAREAAERAAGEKTGEAVIVAMGGDGTISEVMDGIWDHPEVTFAFIPIGSGNDFARSLGISSNWRRALDGILSEKHRIYFHPGRLEYDGKVLFHEKQTPARSREMVELVRRTNVAVLYERSDAIFIDRKARTLPNLQKLLELYESKQLPFADVPEDGDWYTDKFVIWYDGESDLEGFQAGLTGKFDYIDRGNGFAEMVPCGCSKATGMEKMMQLLGADRSHVFAVGDSLNDRPMLEAAGTGIAMGDSPMLHPYADYITANLADDGLEKALAHFDLI